MKKLLLALIVLTTATLANAASLSLTLPSLSPITQGNSTTLTASVQAVGGSVSGVSLTLGALPTGLSTTDSLVQSVGSLSSGQSSSKSWTITGDSSGSYTLTVTASGTGVSSSTSSVSLIVNEPAFIEVQNFSCTPTSLNVGSNVTISFNLKNTGGEATSVTADADYNSSIFSLSSGIDPWTNDINASQTGFVSWVFSTSDAGSNQKITADITSNSNNPENKECSITVSAVCGDSLCSNTESCSSCATDCGQCSSSSSSSSSTNSSSGSNSGGTSSSSQKKESKPKDENFQLITNKSVDINYTKEKAESILEETGITEIKEVVDEKKVVMKRTLRVEKKGSGSNTEYKSTIFISLENKSSETLKNLRVVEVIPKNIAEKASQIESDYNFVVIKEDPVIEFIIEEVLAGEKKKISYSVKKNLDINSLKEFKEPAAYFAKVDLCKNVVCSKDECNAYSCNPNTGKCEASVLPAGTPCGTNGVCRQGKCIEQKKVTEKKEGKTNSEEKPKSSQQTEETEEQQNKAGSFDLFKQVVLIIIILVALTSAGYLYYSYHIKEKDKKNHSKKEIRRPFKKDDSK